MRVWEVSSGKCIKILDGHTAEVNSVVLSADGRWALSGSGEPALKGSGPGAEDVTLRLWRIRDGKCLRILDGHPGWVVSSTYSWMHAFVLSDDAHLSLSGRHDNIINLWELKSRKRLTTFAGHTDTVTSVALSADGRWALSGSDDKTLRLWEVNSGKCLRTVHENMGGIETVALSTDGRWALSGGKDKLLHLWRLEWGCDFPEQADWDEGARPYLENFLTLHCALGEEGLTRVGMPNWTDVDFQKLHTHLQYCGYGWLRPEGVRRQLEKMTAEWQGPPAMPWEQAAK
jgi:WD40 repeat protein